MSLIGITSGVPFMFLHSNFVLVVDGLQKKMPCQNIKFWRFVIFRWNINERISKEVFYEQTSLSAPD